MSSEVQAVGGTATCIQCDVEDGQGLKPLLTHGSCSDEAVLKPGEENLPYPLTCTIEDASG